ncbi:MAG: winged helix-turn-helix domain-containing protein [Candidatus Kariarchaeaceae archaeon]|jgi:molybdate transport system regulatory protein
MEKDLLTDLFNILVDYKIWFDKITDEGSESIIGEKKIELLQAIQEKGSIKAASEKIHLDFKTAWEMVHAINDRFEPHAIVVSTRGGGGGTYLTPLGIEIVQKYTSINFILRKILPNIGKGVEGKITSQEKNTLQILLENSKENHELSGSEAVFVIPLNP